MENDTNKTKEFGSEKNNLLNPLALLKMKFGEPKQQDERVYNLDDVYAPVGQEAQVSLRFAL